MGLIKDLFRSIFDKNYNPMVEDGKSISDWKLKKFR